MPPTRRNRRIDFAEQTGRDDALFRELEATQVQLSSDFDDYNNHLLVQRDHDQGPERVFQATGFTLAEFWELYAIVEVDLRAQFGTRGKRPRFGPEDSFYLLMQHLRHNPSNAQLATLHCTTIAIIGETLRRAMVGCHQSLVAAFIRPVSKVEQVRFGIGFAQFPQVALVIDCSVQECTRPSGAFGGHQRLFFSGKHGYHCYKREYAHLPNGIVAFVSDVFPGSRHDMIVCQTMTDNYATFLAKGHDGGDLADPQPDSRSWAVMADKGYTGLERTLRCIIPRKELPTRPLMVGERAENRSISSMRSIVENFYGRKARVFRIARNVFNGDMKKFALVDDIMTALTNYHIGKNPLRAEDGNSYRALLNARIAEVARLGAELRARNRAYQVGYRARLGITRPEESHMDAYN